MNIKTSTLVIIGLIGLAVVSVLGFFLYKSAQTVKEATDNLSASSTKAANEAGKGIVQGVGQGLADLFG